MAPNPVIPLRNVLRRAVYRKLYKRVEETKQWRVNAAAAWNTRLPADRCTDQSCLVSGTELSVSAQSDSVFFQKLPLEIRRLIYDEIVGGDKVRLRVVDENNDPEGDEIGKEKVPFQLVCPTAQALLNFSSSCQLA